MLPCKRTLSLVALLLPGLAGCADAFNAFEEEDNLLHVFATHHATPVNGQFPDRGGDDLPRVFDNDRGWKITLSEAYVVTAGLTLIGCNGQTVGLEMYWGPCAEDMSLADLDTVTVGGRRLAVGTFCEVLVQYAPYDPNAPTGGDNKHPIPKAEEVVGASVFLNGHAENAAGERVGFTLRSQETALVRKDLSTVEDGGPLTIAQDNLPEELTISKTYDRFFDGVDFNSYNATELTDRLTDILADQTFVSHGAGVEMTDG